MLGILRDPVWQFVGALLAVAAMGLSVWIYFAQRTSKRLLVERIVRIPLVTMGPNAVPGLTVSLNGRPINQATVLVVRIENIGNAAIPATDYESPIALIFDGTSEVLDASLSDASPDSLPVTFDRSGSVLRLAPLLLNPGDVFTFRALLAASDVRYSVSARIAGVKRVETIRPVPATRSLLAALGLLVFFGAYVLSPSPMSYRLQDIRSEEIPYMIAMTCGFIAPIIIAIADIKRRIERIAVRIRAMQGDA